MRISRSDRRIATRLQYKVPVRFHIWKSLAPRQIATAENLSEGGIFFATDSELLVGTVLEVSVKMPEEITGEPTREWICSGHVVRVVPLNSPAGMRGIGVQFDCYEVAQEIANLEWHHHSNGTGF